MAWVEADLGLDRAAADVLDDLRALLGAGDHSSALIHGDLTSNVFVDPDGVPVVLDLSPYLRPARWGSAIVVADAVVWNGADAGRHSAAWRASRNVSSADRAAHLNKRAFREMPVPVPT